MGLPTLPAQPLAGVRVLDLASEIGAYGARLLADLGADVLKVEPPGGDPQRQIAPFYGETPDPERSLNFWYDNANKRGVTLDWPSDTGHETLAALVRVADVVVESAPPGAWARLGLDYARLSAENPRLIWVAATGFGQSGPHASYRADELIGWAASGWMSRCGDPDRAPLRAGCDAAVRVTGIWAAVAALAALHQRAQTDRGAWIDLSMQESLAALVEAVGLSYIHNGETVKRNGSEFVLSVPCRIFPARDGHVHMVIATVGQWQALVQVMAEDGMVGDLADPQYENNVERLGHRDHIHGLVGQWIAPQEKETLVERCQALKLPFAIVCTPADVARDPQLAARGYFQPVAHPELGIELPYGGWPFQFDRQPSPPIRRAPRLGEHQGAIEEWLGGTRPALPPGLAPVATGAGSRLAPPRLAERAGYPLGGGPGGEGRPLAGLRVLDFTWAVAGPTCVRILADLGADVAKVEQREIGDLLRGYPPFPGKVKAINRSGYFFQLNRNKRSLTLDLKNPRGRELARRLAAVSDVAVDNYSSGVMARLGLGPEDLLAANPQLIVANLPAFGDWGPRRHYVGFAPTIEAFAGLSGLTGYPDRDPSGMGTVLPDYGGGLTGALAILAALAGRARTGQGGTVESPMFASGVQLLGPALLDYFANGRVREPLGNRHPDRPGGPYGVYRCAPEPDRADRWVAISALDESEWRAFRAALGEPGWADRPEFTTPESRRDNAAELDEYVEEWTAGRTPVEVAATLQAAGVPAYMVVTGPDLVDDDLHLRARKFWPTATHPEIGPARLDRFPALFNGEALPIRFASPLLGEHDAAILSEWLGCTAVEIAELAEERVI